MTCVMEFEGIPEPTEAGFLEQSISPKGASAFDDPGPAQFQPALTRIFHHICSELNGAVAEGLV